MKKTITVNLNGRVFTMDEDAYRLLDKYLNNLRIHFRNEEGASEIITDFEARIEELFSEKTRLGYEVITIEHVEEVIARVGKPDDFADRKDTDDDKQSYFTDSKEMKKKFYRNIDDKMFGGVCSGIAAYFDLNVLAVRIVFIILIFATSLWIVPAYVLAWILVPGAFTAEQKLQMRGKPITVENIGKTVAAEMDETLSTGTKGCLSGFIDLCVGLMKVFLIGIGSIVGLSLFFALIITLIVIMALFFGLGSGEFLGILPPFIVSNRPVLATIAFLFVAGIPIVVLIHAIIAHIANLKPINRAVKWVVFLIWVLALGFMFSSGLRFNLNTGFPNWNRKTIVFDNHAIRGNGILSEKIIEPDEPFTSLEIGNHLYANLQVEQIPGEKPLIVVSGDENLVDQVKYDLQDGRLKLSAHNPFRSENNLTIRIQTNNLKAIRSDIAGNIQLNRAFNGDELEIKLTGPGNLRADSLYIRSLTVRSEGIASVNLSGKVNHARLDLAGAGKINALDLLTDSVYAHVDGIGSIQCNPTDYLAGRLNGIGKITYKEEPKTKNIETVGIGKVGKE